jgi:hypothetical protein
VTSFLIGCGISPGGKDMGKGRKLGFLSVKNSMKFFKHLRIKLCAVDIKPPNKSVC